MSPILAIAIKDLRLLMRDRSAAFFTLVFPLIFGLVFGIIFQQAAGGNAPTIEIAIIDLDETERSRSLITTIVETGELERVEVEGLEQAERRVRLGRLTAVVVVPEGYGESSSNLLAGGQPRIECVVDPGRSAEAGMLRGLLTAAAFRTTLDSWQQPDLAGEQIDRARRSLAEADDADPAQKLLLSTMLGAADQLFGSGASQETPGDESGEGSSIAPEAVFTPVEVDVRVPEAIDQGGVRSAFELTYPQAAAWALVGCVTGFGLSLSQERSTGTLLRLAVAPIDRRTVLLGKALACFLAGVLVLAMLRALFALPVFGVRSGAPWIEFVTILLVVFAFVGLMMLLSTLSASAAGTEGGVRAVLLVLALLGGAGVPLMFFQGFMQTLTMISPFRWAILAIEGSTWRGWSPGELSLSWIVLAALGIFGNLIGFRSFRRWRIV